MKDNLPNYLNPHNIDPGRAEPAHIDTPPGNDSIRPGMNIGTVAVVGKGRPKLQPITMSNAEAISILEKIETDIYGKIAIGKAIDALQLNLNGNAIGALQFNDTSAELQALSHTHTYSQPGVSLLPKAVCPRCGKYMTETGFMNAAVIQCSLHTWLCKECGIRREQAYDWPNFQPQEWHRPTYSIKGGEWIGEDEPKKLKAALDALTEVEK